MTTDKSKDKANGNKETIYIDVDDEITNIIDKVKSSEHKIIALVLPKRASVMQSVVNMKLLKKAATAGKKNVVLITSETALLPLAGVAGLHVAKSLQSKPAIPPLPHQASDETEEIQPDDEESIDTSASIGALAAASATHDDETETIELDNVSMEDTPVPVGGKPGKSKKLKHLKVPNFERFRLGFVLAGLALVLLIVGWYFAAVVMPKAKITIKTDTTSVVSSFDFTASTAVTELDVNDKKIPATQKEAKKTDTEKVPATGQKDVGTKATGTMTLKNCSTSDDPVVVPAGAKFSSEGFIFVSNEAINLPASSFSGGGNCTTSPRNVDVTAEKAGEGYNLGARSYSIALTGIQANGSAMTGGTSKMIKVVTQKDIDGAMATVKARQDTQASNELMALFGNEGLFAIKETLVSSEPKITAAPKLDEEATEVTVSSEVTYTMLGVKKDDLKQIISKDIEDEVDLQKQAITNDGIDTSIMRINNNPKPGEAFISFRTSVTAGPEIDEEAIKEAIRGKKRGEAEKYIGSQPGVKEVVVDYSPFWVYSTPKATKKITIVVEKASDQEAAPTSSDE